MSGGADRVDAGSVGRPADYGRVRPVAREELRRTGQQAANGFAAALEQASSAGAVQLKWSGHATARLRESGRERLTTTEAAKLETAVQRAALKGARESLILMDGMAFIVSVRNQTVITAVSGERIKENIFTNIDSAVIV